MATVSLRNIIYLVRLLLGICNRGLWILLRLERARPSPPLRCELLVGTLYPLVVAVYHHICAAWRVRCRDRFWTSFSDRGG